MPSQVPGVLSVAIAASRRPTWVVLLVWACAAFAIGGCTRTKYRLRADREAHHVIAERNDNPRWFQQNLGIELNPRSRYFDPFDPDRPPMPPDDPASHRYMRRVDGKKGWKHWDRFGHRLELENPKWRSALGEDAPIGKDGTVKLDLDSALKLAYVHSPLNQFQRETLYLSALDVTAERFRLDTQFFGGYDTRFTHNGKLIPKQITFSPTLKRFVLVGPFEGDGVENNRLVVGLPFLTDPAFQARRRFATAGEILVGVANSFLFEFNGPDVNLAASLANFSVVQPLLRGAGKDVALEQLTFEERKLLANLRAYSQFRQGFYTQIAIGELGVTGPQRTGLSTALQSFSGQGTVGGYFGLLQQRQQIRNGEDNLGLQFRTLARLEALLDSGFIDLVQVDQFRQNIESQRADLLNRRNVLALNSDLYKTNQLGLPPDLLIELDEDLISPFQLISRETVAIQDTIVDLQRRAAEWPTSPEIGVIEAGLTEAEGFIEPVQQLFDRAREDLERMEEVVPAREQTLSDEEKARFKEERQRLTTQFEDLERAFKTKVQELGEIKRGLAEQPRRDRERALSATQAFMAQPLAPSGLPTELLLQLGAAPRVAAVRDLAVRRGLARRLISWVRDYLQLVERFALVPAQARLEAITGGPIDLTPEAAYRIALANRLDFMNGRAALVDQWRQIQVNADALQSVLNVTASGEIRTARNNPVSFRAPTGNLRLGLEFDAPFTRLLERNAYRESLIEYQRSRRQFIQSRDALNLGLRALLRNLEQFRENLEIQRRAVRIALRRVDQTQLSLNPAREPVPPGQRPPINPTTAINLLGAQTSLRDSQNAFLAAWLSYYTARMRLYRELGVLALDPDGRWVEKPVGDMAQDPGTGGAGVEDLPPPTPVVPEDLPPPRRIPGAGEAAEEAGGPDRQTIFFDGDFPEGAGEPFWHTSVRDAWRTLTAPRKKSRKMSTIPRPDWLWWKDGEIPTFPEGVRLIKQGPEHPGPPPSPTDTPLIRIPPARPPGAADDPRGTNSNNDNRPAPGPFPPRNR